MILEILDNKNALAARAVETIIDLAAEAVRTRGRFRMALAGGRTPEHVYAMLTGPDTVGRINWADTYLFWGDERFVPHDDERSNYAMARRSLLQRAPIVSYHVFHVDTQLPEPESAANSYERTITGFFAGESPPRFDLILLGLGDDGHTASLFPGKPALAVTDRLVVATSPGVLPPPVDRVTFTYPLINAARNILFLVTGGGKAEALKAVLEGGVTPETHPAAGVKPVDGALTWLVDKDAAGLLRRP